MTAGSSASVHRLVLAVLRARAQSAAADGARARNRLLESTRGKRHFKALENIRRRDIYPIGLAGAFRVRVPLR